jgi:hypothetical protein
MVEPIAFRILAPLLGAFVAGTHTGGLGVAATSGYCLATFELRCPSTWRVERE